MSNLSKLKIVAHQQKPMQSKIENRLGKPLEKLYDQLGMVQVLIDDEVYTRMRRVWRIRDT